MSSYKLRTEAASVLFFIALCCVESTTTKYYTYEEDAPGTEIGNLSQDLKIDPAEDPETSFRFMQKGNSSLIQMRQIDGLLTVGEIIDREQLCPQSPRCMITFDVVAFSKEKFQLIHVEIEVKDINDNSPKFPHNETYLEISEDVSVGTRFPLDIAVDQDVGSNYIQSFQISFNTHFAVETRSREDGVKYAELVLVNRLDREVEDSYTIQVTATDGGSPHRSGSMTVHIRVLDSNDNSPAFEHSSLKVELYEDSPVGFLLLKVHAFDPDDGLNGEVVYAFVEDSSNEVKQVFQIDQFSGAVTLKALVDYETKRSYELNIKAYDLGVNSVPSTCKVVVEIVDVNDNPPEISIKPMTSTSDGVAYITEAAAEESFVALIGTSDRDSGSNGYVRSSLHGHEHFKLQQAYGDTFMIVTTTTLDREKIPEYNLTVVAEDLGSPPFKTIKHYTIRVTDENDNPPLFSKAVYEVSVMENNVPGSYITTVVARDLDMGNNGKVTYKLIDGEVLGGAPLSTFVSVDPVSGSLYTVRSFNYESVKQIEVRIQASDRGSPPLSSTALIRIKVIDQNDNAPHITYPILSNSSADVAIPVNAPPGYLALHVKARDADEGVNGKLTFEILEDEQMLFSINKESGEIVLKYGLTLVCGDVLHVKIGVCDSGRLPLSTSATFRFVVTEMQPLEDQIVVVLKSGEEELSELDVSLVIIIILGGGCGLLLIAIVAVALSCKLNRKGRDYDSKKNGTRGLFERDHLPIHNSGDSNVFTASRVDDHSTSSHHESSSLYSDRSGDSQTKVFLPSFNMKPFEAVSLWPCEKYNLQLSGIGNTDQLSVKDSGKGDSDFNDSDSDISGEGCRKNSSTFHPRANSSFLSGSTIAVDRQERSRVIPTHTTAPRGSGYTIAFSQTPAYSSPHSYGTTWRDSSYGANNPRARVMLQTFPRAGTLLPSFCQSERQANTCHEAMDSQSQDVSTSPPLAEVATTF
ncbi:protocadherin-8 [Megalops cyprinoides]|uniref:protocadherin-8 n=1 Tax=Megalops cyprinoides TaxID=118141 RepID=UPI001863DCD7|nr:protocadherin-8 [Megalops cyprinoides]